MKPCTAEAKGRTIMLTVPGKYVSSWNISMSHETLYNRGWLNQGELSDSYREITFAIMKNGFAIMITQLAIMKKEGSYDEKEDFP